MDDISRTADYSKATIYVYFKNKDEIVNAITFRTMLTLRDKISQAVTEIKDWKTAYYKICKSIADYYFDNPVAYETAAGEINVKLDDTDTPQVFHDIFNTGEEINGILADFIKRGIDCGIVRSDIDVMNTVFVVWGSLSGIIRMAVQKQEYLKNYLRISKEEFIQNGFNMLLKSIV